MPTLFLTCVSSKVDFVLLACENADLYAARSQLVLQNVFFFLFFFFFFHSFFFRKHVYEVIYSMTGNY